jgi:hypothetical protein
VRQNGVVVRSCLRECRSHRCRSLRSRAHPDAVGDLQNRPTTAVAGGNAGTAAGRLQERLLRHRTHVHLAPARRHHGRRRKGTRDKLCDICGSCACAEVEVQRRLSCSSASQTSKVLPQESFSGGTRRRPNAPRLLGRARSTHDQEESRRRHRRLPCCRSRRRLVGPSRRQPPPHRRRSRRFRRCLDHVLGCGGGVQLRYVLRIRLRTMTDRGREAEGRDVTKRLTTNDTVNEPCAGLFLVYYSLKDGRTS